MADKEKQAYENLIQMIQNGIEEELNIFERATMGAVYAQGVYVDQCKSLVSKAESGELKDEDIVAEFKGITNGLKRVQEEIRGLYSK